jgi:replicative DNA helicase
VTTPREPGSESYVLSAMLHSEAACRIGVRQLSADDFYEQRNALVFTTIAGLVDRGAPVDPVSVEQTARLQLRKFGGAVVIADLIGAAPTAVNVEWHIDMLRHASQRRQLLQVSERLHQVALGETADLTDRIAESEQELGYIRTASLGDGPVPGLSLIDDWLGDADEAEDWVVPGLIAPADVMLLLAPPGIGKSVLSRQLVMSLAAGVHPLRPELRIEPRTAMLVDLENPSRDARADTRKLRVQLSLIGEWVPQRAVILYRPEGLDLRRPRFADEFERAIEQHRPALVCLGSLYKAAPKGRDDWDTAADEARAVFDRLRSDYGFALWLEHHMNKLTQYDPAMGSPYGSSIWERWPSYGRVLRRIDDTNYELSKPFRGDRAEREIPAGLHRGGLLPWSPIWDREEVEIHKERARPRTPKPVN